MLTKIFLQCNHSWLDVSENFITTAMHHDAGIHSTHKLTYSNAKNLDHFTLNPEITRCEDQLQ